MKDRSTIVLDALLRALKPAARLLLQNGVSYGAFAAAMKRVFLAAAQDELKARGMAQTDSAITLLSGVHRRDVRTLLRAAPAADDDGRREPLSMSSEVVGRWLTQRPWLGDDQLPATLPRGGDENSFDALVASVSSDIRPRAVLDELKRLGVAAEGEDGSVSLLAEGFAPKQGFEEMNWLLADHLHDHLAAAAANVQGQANFLEQSVHVDQISPDSARALQKAAQAAWRQVHRDYFKLASQRFDADAALPADQRQQRARFGVYFFTDREADPES